MESPTYFTAQGRFRGEPKSQAEDTAVGCARFSSARWAVGCPAAPQRVKMILRPRSRRRPRLFFEDEHEDGFYRSTLILRESNGKEPFAHFPSCAIKYRPNCL
jgi:hypothetical protein